MAAVRPGFARLRKDREFGGGSTYGAAAQVLSRLARPLIILPAQIESGRPTDNGEARLLRRILLSAIADIIAAAETDRVAPAQRANAALARRWIAGEPGAPISFEMACAAFGISASSMRRHVETLTGHKED
jgi:hypothetical protein